MECCRLPPEMPNSTPEPKHQGGCQCGAVRFAFYAEPIRVGVCHCKMCRRATAGAFAALADIPHEDFAWTKIIPASYQSSSTAIRDFCANCGTPLSYRKVGGPNTEILLGAFDNPECLVPTYAVCSTSKMPWLDRISDLPDKLATTIGLEQAAADMIVFQDVNRSAGEA